MSPRSLQCCVRRQGPAAVPKHGRRWLGTPCAPVGMGDQPPPHPSPSRAARFPPHHTPRTFSRRAEMLTGWLGRDSPRPGLLLPIRSHRRDGFWGNITAIAPRECHTPLNRPAGMLAFGDQVPIAAIPYMVHMSRPCMNTPRAVQPPQPEGGFSCLRRRGEHPRCLRPPSLLPYISPSPFTRKYWPARSSWQPHLQWKCIRHLH